MKLTRDEIVRKSRAVHGDKYEYGEYLGYNTKMKITCPIHGEFEQTPHDHIGGHGCRKCFDERSANERKLTTEKFIEKAKKKYGDTYDYSQVNYIDSKTKVKIKCNKCGLVFEQRPAKHLSTNGCPSCSRKSVADGQRTGLDEFVKRAREIHGDKYDYSQFVYINSGTRGTIICPIHGPFEQAPGNHIGRQEQGCPKCGRERGNKKTSKTREQFISDARKVHGGKYDYSKVVYINKNNKVIVTCPKHGDFLVSPGNHTLRESGCPKCVTHRSGWEKEVSNFVLSLCSDAEHSNREILNGKELDIYVPSKHIAIECDGLRWHNESHRDNDFHIRKTNDAENAGIRLIHIFEDEWIYKEDIVKSILSNILGKTKNSISARECEIRDVSPADKKKFIEENHIQGDAQSSVNIGLYHNNELVSVMTFGKPRLNVRSERVEGNWELIRFCNKLNTRVVGGASKLLKHFQRTHDYNRIVSFCDKRWSDGTLYGRLGFMHDHDSRPNYFYVVNTKRENRFKYRKSELVKQGYPSDKSEHEIMLERKIYRIYDCGTKVYYLDRK